MNETCKEMLHCYDVRLKSGWVKTRYIKGCITKVDGKFYVNGKEDPEICSAVRLEHLDRIYRKPFPKKVRQEVYEMFGGRCAYCGKALEPRQLRIDHIKPVVEGGEDSIDNLYPSCHDCNTIKDAATAEDLRNYVGHFLDTIKKDIRYRMLLSYGLIQETPHEIKFLYEKEEQK